MFSLSHSLLLVIISSESHLSSLPLLESCREFFKWPMMLQILVSLQIRHSSSSHGMLAVDAQTLALIDEGMVFSWGDGDFGKLGRGGNEGCAVPANLERLNGVGII